MKIEQGCFSCITLRSDFSTACQEFHLIPESLPIMDKSEHNALRLWVCLQTHRQVGFLHVSDLIIYLHRSELPSAHETRPRICSARCQEVRIDFELSLQRGFGVERSEIGSVQGRRTVEQTATDVQTYVLFVCSSHHSSPHAWQYAGSQITVNHDVM